MKLLLLSHGGMSKGVYESACMICGELPHLYYDALQDSEGIQSFEKRLSERLDGLAGQDFAVLTDLQGGSPYNTCLTLLAQKNMLDNVPVIGGMNLPLVISLALKQDVDLASLDETLHDSRMAMNLFSSIGVEDDEEL